MITALMSLSGSPGVSCLSLAMAVTWPRDVLLLECDPSGGAVAFGLLRGESATVGGIYPAMTSVRRGSEGGGSVASALARNVYALDSLPSVGHRVLWCPGFSDPGQATALTESEWTAFVAALREVSEAGDGIDVVVDAGRLHARSPVWPVLRAADRLLLVLRPSRAAARLALSWSPMLESEVGSSRTELVLNGPGRVTASEMERAVGMRVTGTTGNDDAMAAFFSGEGPCPKRLDRSGLLQGARALASTAQPIGSRS